MQSGDSGDDSGDNSVDDTEHTHKTNISDDDMPWLESPTTFTTANLHSEGIIPVKGRNYVLIDSDHPVVSLLKRNTHIIGIDIETTEKVEGQWYRISNKVLQVCCEAITRNAIISDER